MAGPIEGIKIIDVSTVLMAPYATRILGDLGADVIKIESPEIDSLRTVPPARSPDMSGFTLNLHANKRSVVLDLKHPEGRAAALALIARADVLVHNLRPAAVVRLGLDYPSVRVLNERIVYCNACGFGRDGAYEGKPAYDDVIQAASGIAATVATARGEPGYYPSVICDKVGGLTIAYAVLAGLLGRSMGRPGQEIEVAMFETAVAFNAIDHLCAYAFEPPLGPAGWQRVLARNRRPFETADGQMCLLPYSTRN